jgi:hypothetical protein
MDSVHGIECPGPGANRRVQVSSTDLHVAEVSKRHGVRTLIGTGLAGSDTAVELTLGARQVTEIPECAGGFMRQGSFGEEDTCRFVPHSHEFPSFTGYAVISNWSWDNDAPSLFNESLRALALKAAVWVATGDDLTAALPIAAPVDEMTHAMLAQTQLLHGITAHVGVRIIHQTDQEHTAYRAETVTHDYYTAAWGEPPTRYWLDHEEARTRRDRLDGLHARVGINDSGLEHSIDFAAPAA